jgi:hypothetical protein
MDLPHAAEPDVLALPLRAELFRALAGLHRPATTHELAAAGLLGRLAAQARLTGSVAKDPYRAGCAIELET